jgi:hypothetical protein
LLASHQIRTHADISSSGTPMNHALWVTPRELDRLWLHATDNTVVAQ